MSNLQQQQSVRSLLSQDNVKARFQEILKDRAASFTANLAVMVNNSAALKVCDPMTIISAAVVAASLNLPLDPNLGFAAVVPYKNKQKDGSFKDVAQFQIMYKGFNQLAMRSGQYKTIGVSPIYQGQLLSENPLTSEYEFDFNKKESDTVIGYAAYFKLINGFEKTIYWPIDKIDKHGKRFSKTYAKGFGLWKEDFESMASKTVLKHLLSKWGFLSIEMQEAVKFDQGVIKDESQEVEYIDADETIDFETGEVTATRAATTEPEKQFEQKEEKPVKQPEKEKTPGVVLENAIIDIRDVTDIKSFNEVHEAYSQFHNNPIYLSAYESKKKSLSK